MLKRLLALLLLLLSATFIRAAPINSHGNDKVLPADSGNIKVITYGTRNDLQQGTINDTLKYQSTGILGKNCPDFVKGINECYTMALDSKGMYYRPNRDSERQRIEFLTSGMPQNSKWEYTWYTYLDGVTDTTKQFTHLWQILTDGGPLVTLTARNEQVSVENQKNNNMIMQTVPLDKYVDRLIRHHIVYDFKSNGAFRYSMTDGETGNELLTTGLKGYVGSGFTYVKTGIYRNLNRNTSVGRVYVGDFVAKQIDDEDMSAALFDTSDLIQSTETP